MFSSLFFIILFYGICIYAMCCDGGKQRIKQIYTSFTKCDRLILVLILSFFTCFVLYWVKQDRYIYFWDYSGYWSISISRMEYMFNSSISDILKTLHQSINTDEYNIFLPTIVAFPLKVFGYTFPKYVIICCMMFLVPSFFAQGLVACKLIQNREIRKNRLFLIAVAATVCFAGNYYAVFRGYIDVAYLLPMSAAMYLFVDYDFKRISLQRNIGIALTLILTWICRRYTIFFLIGYVAAMLVKAAAVFIQDRDKEALKKIIINFLQIGLISLVILLIFFKDFFFNALFNNYGNTYSAYDDPVRVKIRYLAESFGLFSCALVALIGVGCLVTKKQIVNYLSLVVMSITEILVFWQIQNMSRHHRMILNLPVFLLFMLALEQWKSMRGVVRARKRLIIKNAAVLISLGLVFFNFVKAYSNELSTKGCAKIWSERYYPLRRGDIDSLRSLCDRLNELTAGTEDQIYVAASGVILNADILRKIDMPDSFDGVPHMVNSSDVDLRDGFPTAFLHSKYVVITDPVQTHLNIGQEVVTYLAAMTGDDTSYIGCHFEYMESYELDGGVTAKLYRKTHELEEADLVRLREYYSALYPGYDDIFSDRIR